MRCRAPRLECSYGGAVTGVQRTWLDPAGGKAPVPTPRRARGQLRGHAVRFTPAEPAMPASWPPGRASRRCCRWADNWHVPQIAFKPDFARHKNAAPFKRNDQLLDTLPIGVVVFPGSGISDNLAEGPQARHLAARPSQGWGRVSVPYTSRFLAEILHSGV